MQPLFIVAQRVSLLPALVVVSLLGCSATTDESSLAGEENAIVAGSDTFENAVVRRDCPDPGVTAVTEGDRTKYYMVCTGGRFAIRQSTDLVTWRTTGKFLLPSSGKASWAANGERNWAPEIHAVGPGQFVAYFTAADARDRLAIGVAYAPGPLGPWTVDDAPLVQHEIGVIDATFFADRDGQKYLYWKVDGNQRGERTPILVQPLNDDGRDFRPGSRAREVLTNDPETWEGGVVEAPWVMARDGRYYMFYAGNAYDGRYRTGVARADSPLGPFEKFGNPILENNAAWVGPGHGSIVTLGDTNWFVHHAWSADRAGDPIEERGRWVLVDRVFWGEGWPWFENDSSRIAAQPLPNAIFAGMAR